MKLQLCFFLKKTFSSIILIDMTAEEFVEKKHKGPNFKTADYHPSLYDKFRVELAKMLGTKTYVDIFTLMNQPTLPRTLDIRYAVHGSPYYKPIRLDCLVHTNRSVVGIYR